MRGKESTVRDAISSFLDAHHIRGKYHEALLTGNWETIVGKAIAERTTDIRIKDHQLVLTISSAPLRQELRHLRGKVLSLVNDFLGEQSVTDLVVR